MAPVPSPAVCVEQQRLTKAFIKAVSEYHRMQSAQIAALRMGMDSSSRNCSGRPVKLGMRPSGRYFSTKTSTAAEKHGRYLKVRRGLDQ